MTSLMHYRVFVLSVLWTLALLWLGSVVHATGSSLACPDWPTCFGTMMPEMTGGVFWEHLHRLVAGGLILIFLTATGLAWRVERDRPWIRKAALLGVVALVIQSLLGGLTVVLKLPDAVSSAHLGLAYLFLALAVVIALATAPSWTTVAEPNPLNAGPIRTWAVTAAAIVFAQSILGAVVRHTESGMACPDIPLCLGELIPPLSSGFVALHFFHRVLGFIVLGVVTALFFVVRSRTRSRRIRTFAAGAAAGVVVQVALGFISVYTTLGVVPVSLHTLVAALIMVFLTAIATLAWPRDATVAQRDGPGREGGATSGQPHPSTASTPDAATSEGLPLGS